MTDLAAVAATLVAPGQGVLAADESIPTMSARLVRARVAPTEENRRAYREMLVTAPALAGGISGVILSDETLRQQVTGGRPFPEALAALGMLTGIRADAGARPLPGAPGETVTEGLDCHRGFASTPGSGPRSRNGGRCSRSARAPRHRRRCGLTPRRWAGTGRPARRPDWYRSWRPKC